MKTLCLIFGLVLPAHGELGVLPVEDLTKEGTIQAIQQSLDGAFSVNGGTIAGRVFVSSNVEVTDDVNANRICFRGDGTCQTTAAAIGARVYHSVDTTILTSAITALSFDSERYDTDNFHDNVTNNSRLTVPRAGKYLVTFHFAWGTGTSGRRIGILRLNGTTQIARDERLSSATAIELSVSMATVYEFAAGDYVQAEVFQDSGASQTISVDANWSTEFTITHLGD